MNRPIIMRTYEIVRPLAPPNTRKEPPRRLVVGLPRVRGMEGWPAAVVTLERTREAVRRLNEAERAFRERSLEEDASIEEMAGMLDALEHAEAELGRAFADDTPHNDRAVAESIANCPQDIAWVRWLVADPATRGPRP